MLEWLKATWAKWKVQLTVVGGVLVIATAYGTCTYEPVSDEVSSTTTNTTETVQVNATTTEDQTTNTNNTDNTETNSTIDTTNSDNDNTTGTNTQ